ncbi:ATP phosphoribosyltransferase [Candidatus Kaiserbacteria bacterium RIFCSPHIGHO2_02_FULL_49_16]|uniref:ATP phosphoribosyltransferase n=1 Tax=Candidatus Kaiserbacteria bacterium RIFCSPHIGHO2_02_FULL_49_16 TaxID=1798490 RepID=A0A1F6D9H1_9BACT|nr:MAG: ATP phosphoribosyltransferase [Candidatus Kaiserbacteria bacterium RIFCSPHIGHO2_02_FULL_49_16]
MMHIIYEPERQRMAIQKSGRLHKASMDFLSARGLIFPANDRTLILPCENFDIDLLYLRDDDIPEYVRSGVADFGIVGENVLAEKGADLPIIAKMDFGRCKLVIAAPKDSRIRTPEDLGGKRIATSYPKLLSEYLAREGIEASIVPISGSTEITPELDLADAICDLVQTGSTLKAHDLVPLFTVMESQAVLIESPLKKQAKERFLSQINLKSKL